MNKLELYISGRGPLPSTYWLWPLYGAGLENMGKDGKPIEVPLPEIKPDELLVRHDANGICFSDIKVINQGQDHPRIFKDMKIHPVVLGHEVSMTVVKVGEQLQDRYKVGDRFVIEADIYINNVSVAYGYSIQGGLSQYGVIDQRVLNSDGGNNNLLPIADTTGYAEGALIEPWACVVAAYRLAYRSSIKENGKMWIIGTGEVKDYTISEGFDEKSHPQRVYLTNVPTTFANWIRSKADQLNIEVNDVNSPDEISEEYVDDIVVLGADPDLIEKASPKLDNFGVLAIIADKPMSRKVNVDVGRIHYQRWLYVGTTETDIAKAYKANIIRAELKENGKTLFVGAGGPIGRMHVQAAIQAKSGPKIIVCTDVSDFRLQDLRETFEAEATGKGIEFICLNPTQKETYEKGIGRFMPEGFDNVIALAPVPVVISEAATYLGKNGLMNIFAGIPRGKMALLDLSDVYLKSVRYIGHSGSNLDDMCLTLKMTEEHSLSPNRSVAAIGSLSAARDGIKAVMDQIYPGKVVIYPNIKEFPLTPISDFKTVLPTVYEKFSELGEWTNEAEKEFLRIMLPE